MRFTINHSDLSGLIGRVVQDNQLWLCAWLDEKMLARINASADYELVPPVVQFRTNAIGEKEAMPMGHTEALPAFLEEDFLKKASVNKRVTPCSRPAGHFKRERAFEHMLANSAPTQRIAAHLGVRGFALDPEVVALTLGVSIAECAAVVDCGLYEPDELGAALEAEEKAAREHAQKEKEKQEKAASAREQLVTFRPVDFGLAAFVGDIGADVPRELAEFGGGFSDDGVRVAIPRAAQRMFYTTVGRSPVYTEAPRNYAWPSRTFEGGVRMLGSDESLTVKRKDLPREATPRSMNVPVWQRLMQRRSDIDRSAMGEPTDMRTENGRNAAKAVREYLRDNAKENMPRRGDAFSAMQNWPAIHLERITRCFGALTTDCLLSLLKAEDWAHGENEQALIERFQKSGEFFSRGDYPVATQADDPEAWRAALAELVQTNEEPTSEQAREWCKARGLETDAPHVLASAFKALGYKQHKTKVANVDVRKWVKS